MKTPGETLCHQAGRGPRVLFRALYLLFPVLAINCSQDPMTPMAPKWDVDLTVPIADRTLTLGEMIERDTSLIHQGAGNQLVFSQAVSAPPTFVGDQITLTPSDGSARMQLGAFNVTVDPVIANMNVPELAPGSTVPIPPSTFAMPDIANAMPDESAMKCQSGSIGLTIRNNLPVEVVGTSPIRLMDDQGALQASFDFTNISIPARSSRTVYDNLANRTLGNGTSISGLNFRTSGSATPVPIPPDSMLVATLIVNNLRVSEAQVSGVPAQRLMDNDRANINVLDSTLIQEVRAKSGRLGFEFRNKINLGVVFKFRLTELWHSIGGRTVQFEDSVALSALGEASYELNLAGYRISSPSGNLLSSLELISSVVIPNDIDHPVGLHDTDKVEVSMTSLSPIIVDTAVAVLRPLWLDLNTAVALDLGKVSGKFKGQLLIPSASLVLNTTSSIMCPADLFLTLSAKKNAAGDLAVLQVPATQRRLSGGQGVITFDEAEVGRFLSEISGSFPDSIRIAGKVLVNPSDVYFPGPSGITSIGRNCSFSGTVNLNVPLKLGFVGSTYCDTVEVGDGENQGNSGSSNGDAEGVNSGRVMLELENALPMKVGVRLRLLDFLRQPMLTIPQSGQPVQITSAAVDQQGNVILPAHSRVVIELSHAEAQLISPAKYVEYTLDLATSLGSPAVSFKTSDYIHVRCWSEISYGVNK